MYALDQCSVRLHRRRVPLVMVYASDRQPLTQQWTTFLTLERWQQATLQVRL